MNRNANRADMVSVWGCKSDRRHGHDQFGDIILKSVGRSPAIQKVSFKLLDTDVGLCGHVLVHDAASVGDAVSAFCCWWWVQPACQTRSSVAYSSVRCLAVL